MAAGLLQSAWSAMPEAPTRLLRHLGRYLPASTRQGIRRMAGLQRRRKLRRHIRADLGLEGFFEALNERRARYVVLRWFEILPRVRPGGDVDLLIADEEYSAIADLFEEGADGIFCDVYTVSGQPGTSYHGAPYFPPDKAAVLLSRSTTFNALKVPSPEDHFFSLAYHTVYQKGLRSGLPTSQAGLVPEPHPQHDYAGELAALAEAVGIDVAMDMESLDFCLAEHGWRPTSEMIPGLARRNRWLQAVLLDPSWAPAT